MSRIDEVPFYAQRDAEIPAKLYNLWRRAKLHFGMPLELEFEELPGIILLLDEHEWVCINARQNEMPLLAWVEFQDQGRSAIHMPVACKLNYYHYAASKYRALVLNAMQVVLEQKLFDDGVIT